MLLLVFTIYVFSNYFLGKLNKIFIYNVFIFFWFFGFFRLEYFELSQGQDYDIEYLKYVVGNFSMNGSKYLKLLFQIFFANIIILFFIKKLNFNRDSIIKTKSSIEYVDILLSLLVFIISIFIIREELFSIVVLGSSGYDLINNFGNNGGNYSLHVFLNRLSLILLFSSIVQVGSIKSYHGITLSIYLLFYLLTGQRNELFRFIIALAFWFLSVKSIKFKLKYVLYGIIVLMPLRVIEVFRGGGTENFSELIFTSLTTILNPLFGAESIIPFYSWPSVIFYDIKYELSNLLFWFLDSINLTSYNALTSYSIYKEKLFPMENRGLAINIFASLNIYFNWLLVVPLFALITFTLYRILKFWSKSVFLNVYLLTNYRSVILFWSFASIVLLGRNGIEGLRPLLLHDFLIYPFVFILLSQLKKVRFVGLESM